MNTFTISQLSRFSGVKPHTIRAWEQRYGALKPHRSEGNTRYYDSNQLRRLLNMVSLASDYKLSALARLSDDELFELIYSGKLKQTPKTGDFFLNQLSAAAIGYDVELFEKVFKSASAELGVRGLYTTLILPFLQRVGLLWSCNALDAGHEHFITQLIRQKLMAAIDALPVPKSSSESWLLLLGPEEQHELGLLFAHYLIRLHKQQTIYLGANVPVHVVSEVVQTINPKNLLTFFVRKDDEDEQKRFLKELRRCHRNGGLYVAADKSFEKRKFRVSSVEWLTSAADLEKIIKLKTK